MSVVVVDWLGRGGIAHCSDSLARVLRGQGEDVKVVTRPGRELPSAEPAPLRENRIAAHRAVARHAAAVIRRDRPDTVVVQNYVIPALEWPVYRAAREVGAQLAVVIHDQRLHSRSAGTSVGLTALLRKADTVVAHSRYVGDAVQARTNRPVVVVPLPIQLGLLDGEHGPVPFDPAESFLAVHFGILHRAYKGTDTVADLARTAPEGWTIAVLGVGAHASGNAVAVDRFVHSNELVGAIESSNATLLPYRWATQSGAVVLAQVLGSVVVATDVGGISEQVQDGYTGKLLPVNAALAVWRRALYELQDDGHREQLACAGRRKVWRDHAAFERAVATLVRGGL